jgi:hypothetical protein
MERCGRRRDEPSACVARDRRKRVTAAAPGEQHESWLFSTPQFQIRNETGNPYTAGQRQTGNKYAIKTHYEGSRHHEYRIPEQHVQVSHLSDAALSNRTYDVQTHIA